MSAHEAIGNGQPAHDSTPPPGSTKMAYLNIDRTGISMGPKTIVAILAFVIFLAGGWYAFIASIATKDDLTTHDANDQVHKVVLEKDARPVPLPEAVQDLHAAGKSVVKVVQETKTELITVKNGFHEDRAERLADRAADKVKDTSREPDRKLRRWKRVKAKALENVKAKPPRPIRDGLEDLL